MLIQEAKRLQKLAGIITEDQLNESEILFEETVSDENIENAIAKVLKIDPSKVDLDKIEKEEPSEEDIKDLKESIALTAITIAGLIPPALELVGSTTNWVKRNFALSDQEKKELDILNQKIKDKEKEIELLDKNDDPKEENAREELSTLIKQKDELYGTEFGTKMKEWGHKLHHAYTWPIRKMLDGLAWWEKLKHQVYGDSFKLTKIQDKKFREKLANIIYATIMLGIAGFGVASHLKHLVGVGPVLTTIADGVKAGKSTAEIVQSIASLI